MHNIQIVFEERWRPERTVVTLSKVWLVVTNWRIVPISWLCDSVMLCHLECLVDVDHMHIQLLGDCGAGR